MLRLLASGGGAPWNPRKLLIRLGAHSEMKRLRRILRELEDEGRVDRLDRGAVVLRREDGLVEGVYVPAARGARRGVVRTLAGRELRVAAEPTARGGERVLVWPRGEERGELVGIVAPGRERIVGRLVVEDGSAVIEPFGRPPRGSDAAFEHRVARGDRGGAEDGDVVEAVPVAGRGRGREDGFARVVRRLGRPGEPDADFEAVAWRYSLRTAFPEAALREAEAAVGRADEPGERLDLRALPFATIDPATARDHDDAVCVEPGERAGELRLWVAIADVAHFVPEGGALEREALRRGNSVYLPDRAIPMLPHALSSDACSLVPDVDRLVLACELVLGPEADVRDARFHRAILRSRARLAYEEAAALMESRDGAPALDDALRASIARLAEAAERLRARRLREGSIELELPEPVVVLDGDGMPIDARRAERTVAHRAIEEAMLAANRAVARWLDAQDVRVPHRVHAPPADRALATLADLLARSGLLARAAEGPLERGELVAALAAAVGTPLERLVHWTALRSMKQARYSTESEGHYALGFEHYLHFTSPIRRVADLFVHRAVHRVLAGRAAPGDEDERVERACVRASVCERIAQQAERSAREVKQAALLASRIGDELDAHVTGLIDGAIFATLDAPCVEGMLDAARLGAGFALASDGLALVAERSGRRIALGDAIRVRVEEVDAFRGRVRFGPPRAPARA
ncbi:MAG: VacB/RNase II family 3'-5' exoribonuclease [Myxococcota bacterium]